MKYTVEVEINKPLNRVIELFDSEENAFKWMEGLESWDQISGTPGEPGAKSKMKFDIKGRVMEMVETIEEKNLPERMVMNYTAKGVFNRVVNRFEAVGEEKTHYITEQEFQMKNVFMKIMGFLMPGMFKKQSNKFLQDFKAFCESQEG